MDTVNPIIEQNISWKPDQLIDMDNFDAEFVEELMDSYKIHVRYERKPEKLCLAYNHTEGFVLTGKGTHFHEAVYQWALAFNELQRNAGIPDYD